MIFSCLQPSHSLNVKSSEYFRRGSWHFLTLCFNNEHWSSVPEKLQLHLETCKKLSVCRSAIEMLEAELRESASRMNLASALIPYSLFHNIKKLYFALLQSSSEEERETTVGELNKSYMDVCQTSLMPPVGTLEFMSMCRVLHDQGLLKVGQSLEDRVFVSFGIFFNNSDDKSVYTRMREIYSSVPPTPYTKRGPTKSVLGKAKVDGLVVVESLKNLEIPKRSATSHKHGTSAKPSAPILYGGMLSEPADLQRQECRPKDAVSIKHSKTNLRVCGALWTTILHGAIFGVGSKTSNGIEVLQPSGKKVQQKLCMRDKEFSRQGKGEHEEGKIIGINDRSGLRGVASRFRGADGQRGRCHALGDIVSQFPYVREMAGGLRGVHRADHLEGTKMMSLWANSWNQQGERDAKTCPRTDKGRGLLGEEIKANEDKE
ncbi:Cell division control protein [Melia azedarach]|uniref:Cell division control protein n=1 Tax=Melia azedarach TaxID=155640 RepID=A0ACC1YJI6_MELAZ|nr:Cell division control protein [Melia azedarach]